MSLRKINYFEADLKLYDDGELLSDQIKATFDLVDGSESPKVDFDLILKLMSLSEANFKAKLPRKHLPSELARYGVTITLQERTHWVTELATRALSLVKAKEGLNPRTTNSEAINLAFSELLAGSLAEEDEWSGIISSKKTWLEVKKLLKRVFYISAKEGESNNEVFEGYSEIFIPACTYHPIPLLRYLLLGIIEPKLLSDKEFIDVVIGFNLIKIEEFSRELELKEFDEEFKRTVIQDANIDFFALREEYKNPIDHKVPRINIDGEEQKKYRDDTGIASLSIDRTIISSKVKLGIISVKDLDAFIETFEILKRLAPRAGTFK